MAHHKSALKRIRSNETKRLRNRYHLKTSRTYIKKLRDTNTREEAEDLYKKVASILDKLAKRNIIHKKNASNKKSKLLKFVHSLEK